MTIKQCFKFSDTLSFSNEYSIVSQCRQSHQIAGSIVIFNSVQMMNNPTIRQWFAISLLPNKDMFHYIPFSICPMVLWSPYFYVTVIGYPTAFPKWAFVSTKVGYLASATMTTDSVMLTKFFPTILAITRMFIYPSFYSFSMSLLFIRLLHKYIMAHLTQMGKIDRNAIELYLKRKIRENK